MAKDMMAGFALYQPADLANVKDLLKQHGKGAWLLAGGNDSLDWFKDRVKRPVAVIDLAGIESMKGIRDAAGGVEIGALTTLTEVEQNALIRERFPVLADAARMVASPQIRNTGTLGGNVCQDTRCWYYRTGTDCYRAGGNTCYADTPEGQNREHCLFGADRCVAVSPSDTAPALIALDAEFVISGAAGDKTVKAEDFFVGPAVDIERMTILQPGDVLTSIKIPATWAGSTQYFEKVADRNAWDFALVNIAAAIRVTNGVIDDIRLAAGGVECVPKRLGVVEQIVKGSAANEETAGLAATSASRGATALNQNHFKIPLLENLVRRAIRGG